MLPYLKPVAHNVFHTVSKQTGKINAITKHATYHLSNSKMKLFFLLLSFTYTKANQFYVPAFKASAPLASRLFSSEAGKSRFR